MIPRTFYTPKRRIAVQRGLVRHEDESHSKGYILDSPNGSVSEAFYYSKDQGTPDGWKIYQVERKQEENRLIRTKIVENEAAVERICRNLARRHAESLDNSLPNTEEDTTSPHSVSVLALALLYDPANG